MSSRKKDRNEHTASVKTGGKANYVGQRVDGEARKETRNSSTASSGHSH